MLKIVKYFLKLGILGFGGPFVLIAQMQRDLVEKEQWITQEKFNMVLPLIKTMPGSIAFQMAIYLGRQRAGALAGILSGIAIVLPAFLIVLVFAAFESLATNSPIFRGLQIAALAVIFGTCVNLTHGFEKLPKFWFFVIVSFVLTWMFPKAEAVWIVGLGLLFTVAIDPKKFFAIVPFVHDSDRLPQIFWTCFKAGAFTFGSGLAIIPLMEYDFVNYLGWLNHTDFMNGLAIGQVSPGPVAITATFLGFKVAGFAGALTATVGIFLASTVNMLTWFPRAVDYVSRFSKITLFSTGSLAAAIGAIAAACLKIALQLQLDPLEIIVVFVTLALMLFVKKIPVWVLVIGPGVIYFFIRSV